MATKLLADRPARSTGHNSVEIYRNGSFAVPKTAVPGPEVAALLDRVLPMVEEWREHLTVSIGRATELTGLKDTQIRYFEELYGQERDTSAPAGATRSYSLADLHRLAVFAELLKQGYRPAQATEIMRSIAHLIDRGATRNIANALRREGDAITDGFLLSRLASQVIFAAQLELRERAPNARITAMFVVEQVIDLASTVDATRAGSKLAADARDMLVALDRATIVGEPPDDNSDSMWSDDESSIVLFYSRESWSVPLPENVAFCCYRPPSAPEMTVVFAVQSDDPANVPPVLTVELPVRDHLLDWMVRMCRVIFPEFRQATHIHGYRYRSDGYRLAQTRDVLNRLMQRMRGLIFGDDADVSMACLLLPNDLYKPTHLSILAHAGYSEEIARRVRLGLQGEGDGLSGRAFIAREPFLTRDAAHDERVYGAQNEHCEVALAVPLLSHWDTHPFGVLYLASQRPASPLLSETAFVALVFSNILSELLGRWWLTRLRRRHDALLHSYAEEYIRWFNGMDLHSPEFEEGVRQIERVWERAAPTNDAGGGRAVVERMSHRYVTLAVLDIDRCRNYHDRGDEPFLLAAQRHVQKAIEQILPGERGYWFKNDHTLLVLEGCSLDEAVVLIRRIASRVQTVPVMIAGRSERTTITISAALKALSYQELYDLSHHDRDVLRSSLTSIIEALYEQTHGWERTIRVFQNGVWSNVS
ncbi:MAG: MerR family transcriptional regulator [Roseiflexus sp.]